MYTASGTVGSSMGSIFADNRVMAANAVFSERVTVDEFFRIAQATQGRIELWEGRIVAMANASANHILVQGRLSDLCNAGLRGRKCRFLGESSAIVIDEEGTYYNPDGTISCPPIFSSESRGTLSNPTVVFEILSPSTADKDRTTKFDGYATLPSIKEIVLIESERVRVEVYERREDGWLRKVYLPGAVVRLASVEVDLPLDELYEDTVFEDEA